MNKFNILFVLSVHSLWRGREEKEEINQINYSLRIICSALMLMYLDNIFIGTDSEELFSLHISQPQFICKRFWGSCLMQMPRPSGRQQDLCDFISKFLTKLSYSKNYLAGYLWKNFFVLAGSAFGNSLKWSSQICLLLFLSDLAIFHPVRQTRCFLSGIKPFHHVVK